MRSGKLDAFRLSSNACPTCEDLYRLNAAIETARRNARNLHGAAVKRTDSAAPQNLEEELKQTSDGRKFICYAVLSQLSSQQFPTLGARLAA